MHLNIGAVIIQKLIIIIIIVDVSLLTKNNSMTHMNPVTPEWAAA